MSRIFVILIVALTAFACDHRASPPKTRDEVGLLLGLSSGRTVLLVRRGEDAGFELAAERRPLLVPHDTGFYWVGTVARCIADTVKAEHVGARELVNREERVYSVRAGDTAVVNLAGRDCREMERVADAPAAEDVYCSNALREITYASPTLVTYLGRDRTTELCTPAHGETTSANVARRLESESRVSLRSMLSPLSWTQVVKQVSDTSGNNCGVDAERAPTHVDSSWAVRHADGRWIATTWMSGTTTCRGGRDLDLSVALDSIPASPPLQTGWSELRTQFANLVDAAASPSQHYVLLLRLDSLGIAPVVSGKVLAPVLQIPSRIEDRIVMLRWLDVTEAERLRVRMKSLPKPEIRLGSESF